MALGFKLWLAPLRLIRAPVDEICMTLLLSLRFMSVVFEELRNLSLGLAARSVPWKQLPPGAGLQVVACRHLINSFRPSSLLLIFGMLRDTAWALLHALSHANSCRWVLAYVVVDSARLHHAILHV